jgi:lipopolysaccharide export system protein LptA
MQEIGRRKSIAISVRAHLPRVSRVFALLVIVIGIVFVSVSYYRRRNHKPFVLLPGAPELSKEVTGVFNGYEQRIMKGDRLYMWLKASKDVTFSDGHHELEDVHLEIYPPTGDKPDQIVAQRSIYDQKNGLVSFVGDVQITTRENLKAKTETLVYNENSGVAETNDPISFERDNVSGSATGGNLNSKNKHLELRSNVEITVVPERNKDGAPRPAARPGPVTIHSAHAVFDQLSLSLLFAGGATAEQGQDVMSGDNLAGTLDERKKLRKIEARGNSYLRSMTEGHAAEVHSTDMDFFLNGDQQLEKAVASQNVKARSLNSESQMELVGANTVESNFQAEKDHSFLKEMRTEGRSVVTLAAPESQASNPRAANKRLTADTMHLFWRTTGRDLERAEAIGNAELFVDPVLKNAIAERKTVTAPRFDCNFYEGGNLAHNFIATGGAKAVIDPLQPTPQRGTRTLTSQKMTTLFVRETQDVDRFDAQGDAKFGELDRNGTAANATYTSADGMVRLRGGEPTVWDSRARNKALEIDSDTLSDVSYCRGKTATTYYSQEQTNGATPFSKTKSPVYIVADRGEFHHSTGVAIYTGDARAWQDDNFVRADKLTIFRDSKRMEGEGHIQSALYQARRKRPDNSSEVVPVFATSDRMFYSDPDRLLHYEGHADIKQGTDRMTSHLADVYLQKEGNEVEKTIAQQDVVVTQPARRGTGAWALYTAADDTVVLTGTPARFEDVQQGNTEGGRLTVYMSENRVVADDTRGLQSAGRVRSTHHVRKH